MTKPAANALFDLIRADHARFSVLAGRGQRGSVWRAFLHPRVAPVAWFRLSNWLYRKGLSPLAAVITQLNILLFKVEIPARAVIGPGLVLPHPMGIVLGSASIGRDVTIFQNVTVGARSFDGAYDLTSRPVIGDGATIGCGAVLLGPIKIGPGVAVRANALITRDMVAEQRGSAAND